MLVVFLLDTVQPECYIPKWLLNFVSTLLEVGNFCDPRVARSIDFVGSIEYREG